MSSAACRAWARATSARTAAGSLGTACDTRFCTWTAARSMSVPPLNVTVSCMTPSDPAVDFM